MRAMILSAGRGERMRPLTDICPKPLLPINGKALIEYHLEKLSQLTIEPLLINTAWLGEQIEAFIGDGTQWGLNAVYSREPEKALETAGGIMQALDLIDGFGSDEPLLVVNGDIYCQYPLAELTSIAANLSPDIKAHLIMVDNPAHNPQGDFSLVSDSELGHLVAEHGKNKLTYSGIALIRPSLFEGLAQGRRALAPVLRAAMAKQQVAGEHYQGLWTDVGTPQRLTQLEQTLVEAI